MASVAQVMGVDALSLVGMIVTAARNATTHRRNCEQMAEHVKIIGNLLEKLKSTELRNFPATGEPLDRLEEALGRALELVESCRDKSYLYLLAMGWSVVYQFRQVQTDIDRYLKLLPLISLVHEYRIQVLYSIPLQIISMICSNCLYKLTTCFSVPICGYTFQL